MSAARVLFAVFLLLSSVLPAPVVHADRLDIERIFSGPDLSGPSLRSARISPDGRWVTYLLGKKDRPGQLDLWAYDIASQTHRRLVDSSLLSPEERPLSAVEAQRRERSRSAAFSGILRYRFAADSRRLLVPLSGDLYIYDLKADPQQAVRRITDTPQYETDARFSPKGRYVSFVRDQNLVVYDLNNGREWNITRGGRGLVSFGMAEFIAQEEIGRRTGYWWSPDDSRIAYTRVDESPIEETERFEILADRVKVVKQRYPVAGASNARVQLFVTDVVDPDAAQQIDLGKDPDFYLARVDWFPDSTRLAVQYQTRDQKTLRLLSADASTGATSVLLTETADTWVDLNDELTFLKDSPQFVWASSRTGFRHLYLYQNDGTLLRSLTAGDWSVVGNGYDKALKGVDEASGLIYFMANADTPLERHLYSASLDGVEPATGKPAEFRRLTQTGGWHSVAMSEDTSVYLDTFSSPAQPPSVSLRSVGGKLLAVLVANELDRDHPYWPYRDEHLPVEFGSLEASDGQTLYYQLIRPGDAKPGQRYPVIVDVYGGPGSQKVRHAWGSSSRSNTGFIHQWLAQHGYVVFSLDNRGTGFRGTKFETALYGQLGAVEVEDQVAGVKFLQTLPFVDPDRIGVFGWSYGGFMALMCAMQAPELFSAAVAGAPVTDWRLYDTHYTERYLGWPQDNLEGYAASNVMNHADGLHGDLLVIHGMADDNVLFVNSTALFKRLQDLDKPFQVMVYPGSKHGLLRSPKTGVHAYRTILRFFDDALKHPEP